jgi:hypothetical protein
MTIGTFYETITFGAGKVMNEPKIINRNFINDLLPYLGVGLVIFLFNPLPLIRSEFWAEDATEFFFGALTGGFKSLFEPVYGYHFFASRLIAFLASLFEALYAPYIYAWASLVLNTVAVAYFARNGFAWIIPKRSHRLIVVGLLAIGPGTSEAFLNLCNLPTSLAFLALMMLLEHPLGLNWKRFTAIVLISLSSGYTVLWLPLIGYLWRLSKDNRYLFLGCVILLNAIVGFWGIHEAESAAKLLNYGALTLVPRIFVENTFTRLIPGPFLGPQATGVFMQSRPLVFWSITLAGLSSVLYLLTANYHKNPEKIIALSLAYLGAIGSLCIIAFARRYALGQLVREGGTLVWELRYSLLPGAIVLIIWFSLLCPLLNRRTYVRSLSIFCMVLISGQIIWHWRQVPQRANLDWPLRATVIESILNQKDVAQSITIEQLAVHPLGWTPNNKRTLITLPPGRP